MKDPPAGTEALSANNRLLFHNRLLLRVAVSTLGVFVILCIVCSLFLCSSEPAYDPDIGLFSRIDALLAWVAPWSKPGPQGIPVSGTGEQQYESHGSIIHRVPITYIRL